MSVASYQLRGNSNNSSRCNSNNNNNSYSCADVNSGAANSVLLAGENTKDRMYEPKHNQKAVRVLTVIAYIFFVSLAAIMLSLYYVFLWNPPPPPQHSKLLTIITGGGNINATDCNHGIFTGQTIPAVVMETPKVMSVLNGNNENDDSDSIFSSTTEMNNGQIYSSINNNDNISYPMAIEDYYKNKKDNFTVDSSEGGSDGSIVGDNVDSDNNYNNNDSNYYI